MNSSKIAVVIFALCALTSQGEELKKLSDLNLALLDKPYDKLTEAQRKERDEVGYWKSIIENGGEMNVPGTPKGRIRFVNLQTRVPTDKLKKVLAAFETSLAFDVAFADADCDAQLKVRIVEKPDAPALLVAPDDAWAEVNVAKLADAKTKPAFLAARTRKEILRAFAYLTAGSTYGTPLYQRPASLRAFDEIADESFPIDIIMRANKHLGSMGLKAVEQSTYRDVLTMGYDVAPTNGYQKAIYDEVKKTHPFTKSVK